MGQFSKASVGFDSEWKYKRAVDFGSLSACLSFSKETLNLKMVCLSKFDWEIGCLTQTLPCNSVIAKVQDTLDCVSLGIRLWF